MVRTDYKDGGFPISTLNPVFCVTSTGAVYIAQDSTHLSQTLQARDDYSKVFGIWPGKANTDTFILDPTKYKGETK